MITIICGGCGYQGEFDEFTRTTVGGDLPANTFQCPVCRLAIKRRLSGRQVFESGLVIERVELVTVQASL